MLRRLAYAIAIGRRRLHTLSLAGKSLLLLGGAVTLIILIALSLPWFRMNALVTESQFETSRELLEAFVTESPDVVPGEVRRVGRADVVRYTLEQARVRAGEDQFVERSLAAFQQDADLQERLARNWDGATRNYRYLRAVRDESGALIGVVLLERQSDGAALLLAVNTLYVLAAGAFVLAVALVVFYLIAERLILAPVRSLTQTAETARTGRLDVRSDVRTGDELERLAETFNLMLKGLGRSQRQLRAMNAALEVKVNEVQEANIALHEAARLKGEFLANVSHELRTPMNSVIGFAELLGEIAEREAPPEGAPRRVLKDHEKRRRYIGNIISAGRGLLDMIESLLEMAKLEAGRVELHIEPISVEQTCRGLVGLLEGIATGKGIVIRLELDKRVPIIETDPKKFQQIVFNLLSNAVKFTDPAARAAQNKDNQPGLIIVRTELLSGLDATPERVRVSVLDNGPGIAPQDQARVFQKFQQLEGGHTKRYQGTGLGLAICKELSALLGGDIQLVSEVGRGSMFSLIVPVSSPRTADTHGPDDTIGTEHHASMMPA